MRHHSLRAFFPSCAVFLMIAASSATDAHPLINNDSGSTAVIADSMFNEASGRADFCVLKSLDGLPVDNSLMDTFARTGLILYPHATTRRMKPQPVRATLLCQTVYATPILALEHAPQIIEAVVDFSPEENGHYIVKGQLVEGRSSVWIEDERTGERVTAKTTEAGK